VAAFIARSNRRIFLYVADKDCDGARRFHRLREPPGTFAGTRRVPKLRNDDRNQLAKSVGQSGAMGRLGWAGCSVD